MTSFAYSAEKIKVVCHLSEIKKVSFVLGNMLNDIKGVGGPKNIDMLLVVHGPAGKDFHKSRVNQKIMQKSILFGFFKPFLHTNTYKY